MESHLNGAARTVHAFYISSSFASASATRLREELQGARLPTTHWPAVMGGPELLGSKGEYLRRGIESHLYPRRCERPDAVPCTLANISAWGSVGAYLSFVTLLEHIARTSERAPNATLLILQDDVHLAPTWLSTLRRTLDLLNGQRYQPWTRCLLSWFGARRDEDCSQDLCRVRPPAGPIDGKRYYHGLQASLLRARAAPCLLRCLSSRRIKSVDALLVGCDSECEPGTTWALAAQTAFGKHAGGSEKAAIDARLRARPLGT